MIRRTLAILVLTLAGSTVAASDCLVKHPKLGLAMQAKAAQAEYTRVGNTSRANRAAYRASVLYQEAEQACNNTLRTVKVINRQISKYPRRVVSKVNPPRRLLKPKQVVKRTVIKRKAKPRTKVRYTNTCTRLASGAELCESDLKQKRHIAKLIKSKAKYVSFLNGLEKKHRYTKNALIIKGIIESNLGTSRRSNRCGVFQHGRPEWRRFGRGNCNNPYQNARATVRLAATYRASSTYNTHNSTLDDYIRHQQGYAGADWIHKVRYNRPIKPRQAAIIASNMCNNLSPKFRRGICVKKKGRSGYYVSSRHSLKTLAETHRNYWWFTIKTFDKHLRAIMWENENMRTI